MNLDLFSLNLKSKSKYTTPRAPIKTHLVIEKNPKLYSTPNSAKKSRFVPPIAIPISDLDDFEEKSDRKSSHVKFLTEQRDYSTPRSIQTFVLYRNGDLQYAENATKIQKCWRAYKRRKRFRKFFNFIRSMRLKTLNFALHMWILTLKKPSNISKKSYREVITFMQERGYIIRDDKSRKLITKDQFYCFNNFDQMMSTDFLFMQPRYPPKIISRLQRNFYFPFIQNIFSSWLSLALEKIALRKSSYAGRVLLQKRSLFGPIFWTFYFWQRWVKFKKTRQIPAKSKKQLFILEWSIYICKKKRQMKLNKVADKLHKRYIESIIISQLRIKSANRSVYNRAFENVKKNREEKIMALTLRAFNVIVATKQFKQNIKRRVIRSWYKVVDEQIIDRMKEKVLKYRSFLKCLKNSFKKWHSYVIDEGIRKVYLHNLVTQNSLLLLKTFFLLKSDYPHFAFVAAFLAWKKILIMNNNKRKFIFWSSKEAKKKVTLQSLLHILKENAAIRKSYDNFALFGEKKNPNDLHEMYRSSSSAKNGRKKKLIKAMKRINEDLPPVKVFTTSVDQTMIAYNKLNEFEMIEKNWHEKMSSNDVKNLFYRMIIVLSKKSSPAFMNNKFKTAKEKIEILNQFRSDNFLYNSNEIHGYKIHQDRQDKQRQIALNNILKRDSNLFMAFDTHEAAISLHNVSNKFAINQIPIEDVTSIKPKNKKSKSKKQNKKISTDNENENENINELKNINDHKSINFQRKTIPRRVPKEVNPDHPLLRSIDNIKESINSNNRKYRRSPDDIFDTKESSSTIHNIKLINKLTSTSSQAKFQLDSSYEQFTPLNQSLKATRMMSSREFLLKELSNMHDAATCELEKINECNEYEMFSKADLEKIDKDDLSAKEVVLPNFNEIPTIYNTKKETTMYLSDKMKEKLKNSNLFAKHENENDNDDALSNDDLNNEITIDDLSKNFIDDPGYFEYTDSERAAMLTNKYLKVLEMLIDDSLDKPPLPPKFESEEPKEESIESENEQIRSHISSIVHRFVPKQKSEEKVESNNQENQQPAETLKSSFNQDQSKSKGKQRKKVLFEDPDQQFATIVAPDGSVYKKSKCPEFNNVAFNGTAVLTNKPWETEVERSTSQSSERKLKKKRKRRRRLSIDGFSSSEDEEEDENEYKDDSEFNQASLPKPTFKVPGFDDSDSSGSSPGSIAASNHLLDQINSFLSSSTIDGQEQFIEKLRQEASSTSNNGEDVKRAFMLLVDAVAHKYVLKQLDSNSHKNQISSLVDLEGASSKDSTSEDDELSKIEVIQKKLLKGSFCQDQKKIQKGRFYQEKKYAAFDTDSRLIEPPEIIERKFTFTKDLLATIVENAKFASTLKINYYKDVSKLNPFKGMQLLAKKVREKLATLNKTHVVQSSASYDKNKNEICLSIGSVSNKQKQKESKKKIKAQPNLAKSKIKVVKKTSNKDIKNMLEVTKLEINTRPRTPLMDGCIKPEPGNKKVVRKPIVTKRKPQFTKMSPSTPLQPPEFHVAKEYNDDFEGANNFTQRKNKTEMLTGPPARLKWSLPSDRINITDEDVDFFMFVTPYVMPPEVLNDLLEKQNKTI